MGMSGGEILILYCCCFYLTHLADGDTFAESDKIYFPEENNSDTCFLNGDPTTPGICRSFEECRKAVLRWKQLRQMPQRCYFDGFIEYVCCETEDKMDETNATGVRLTSPRRSANACREEGDNAFRKTMVGRPAIYEAIGIPAASGEFPYMATLGWTSPGTEDITYLCGGVLFSPRFVLTAAHCRKVNGDAPKVVRLGDLPLNATQLYDIFQIKRFISHPEYNGKDLYNDIAVIELEGSTSRFKPACIWLERNYPIRNVSAIGYGQTQFAGPSSNILIKADIFLTSNNDCSGFYPKSEDLPRGLLVSQVCAGDPIQRRDTCQGDSGGPMVLKVSKDFSRTPVSYIVGLTSLGEACGGTTPGIYTRVAHYIDWIEGIVWPRTSS